MKTSNCIMNTSMSHLAILLCAILLSSLFPSEPALAQGCSTPSFGPPRWFGTGTASGSVTVGDFNGDGKLDLAVAGGNNVSVLLGNGDGTFQTSINSAAGESAATPVVGDFNGDGKLDLAFGAGASGLVSVLLGNGDGTFQAPAFYYAGPDPLSIAGGDFNRDGKLDLVVANRGSGANNFTDSSVLVLMGNGDGTFQPAVAYGPVANPYSIKVGDFNGDGNLDLAVANGGVIPSYDGAGVSVLLGNGDGTFQSAVTYEAGVHCYDLAVGDFNGDGKPDLAVRAVWPERFGVLLGNGDGTFQAPAAYSPVGNPFSLAVGDFNGDGRLDLALAIGPSGPVSVLLGNGDGTFQTAANYTAGTYPVGAAVGDFNGDGKPDLAVVDNASTNVAVLLNTCVSTGPSLAVSLSNATLTLFWPFPSTGFVLESTPSLSPPNWQPAVEAPLTNNGLLEVLVPVNPGSRYFRLHKP